MILVLLGAPGAGKGTQGALLSAHLDVPRIATGDILRDAVRNGTEAGTEASRYMDAGELVPDDVILKLVREALRSPDAEGGAILDGFPRNVSQARALSELLVADDRRVGSVVVLDVAADVVVRRLGGRRTDPETGKVYHLEFDPPPAEVKARLERRPDDEEATIRHRLDVYARQTAPLVDFYEGIGVPVHRVDGAGSIEKVREEVVRATGAGAQG